jgi:adenosylcobinamide-phosphate synthase
LSALVAALLLDAALGEPRWLWSRAPHPAVAMGRAVDALDARLNRGGARRLRGAAALAILAAGAALAGWGVAALPGGAVPEALAAAVLLAQRSLVDHVRDVARGLARSVEEGRAAVALIVGRDTAGMDGPAIARAAIESAAENLSDGVVAPAFWFAVAGLPGMAAYKAVNTADSMIGHRTPRHEAFGWAAARTDDALNWIPARLTALALAALSGTLRAWPAIAADARRHRSPNAGWPEAAAARALGVALSGPRSYGGRPTAEPFVHPEGRRNLGPGDVEAATRLLWRGWGALLAAAVAVALL